MEYANLVRGLSLKDRLLNDIPLKRILLGLRLLHKRCHSLHSTLNLGAARVELAKAPRVDHDQAVAIEGVAELKETKRRFRSERNELRATLEATRGDLTAARDAAELATQRADSVTCERDELHIQLEELKAALVSRFGLTEAERLSYQALSGSSEVTGLRGYSR